MRANLCHRPDNCDRGDDGINNPYERHDHHSDVAPRINGGLETENGEEEEQKKG